MSQPTASQHAATSMGFALPSIREISNDDVLAAFADGIADFKAEPRYGLFFGGVYAAGGMILTVLAWVFGWLFLAFPLAAGFVLVGPFVAVGLYEVSRRRELGMTLTWPHVLGAIRGHSGRQIVMLGFALAFVATVWLKIAAVLYALVFGLQSLSLDTFLAEILTTPRGLLFLVVGNVIGAVLAVTAFSISVVSFPYLLDKDVDFATGIVTSVRTVVANPGPMFAWGLLVAGALATAIVPFFLLLPVVLPVLGHATWHLYRRAIAA